MPTGSRINEGFEEESTEQEEGYVLSVDIFTGPKGQVEQPEVQFIDGKDQPRSEGEPDIFVTNVRQSGKAAENITIEEDLAEDVAGVILKEADTEQKENGMLGKVNKISVKISVGPKGQLDELPFEIVGGREKPWITGNPGVFIQKIRPGTLLEKTVNPGNQIIKVEGVDVTDVPLDVVMNLLREADKRAKVQIRKSKEDRTIKVYEDETTAKNEAIVEISTGPRGVLGQLGFKLTGGRNQPCVPGDPGIFVKAIKQGSLVEKIIRPGDKVLKIDGSSVKNVSYRFALDRIKAADRRVRLHIRRAEQNESNFSKRNSFEVIQNFTSEQLEELCGAFSTFDRKEVGRIYFRHLNCLYRSLGLNLTIHDMDLITTEFHLKGDAKISLKEFLQIINYLFSSRTDMNEDINEAFEVFDREGKGHFSVKELAEAFQSMPEFQKVPSNEVTEILKSVDANGDGLIRYKDFKELLSPLFYQY